jgi:hypothetical protein
MATTIRLRAGHWRLGVTDESPPVAVDPFTIARPTLTTGRQTGTSGVVIGITVRQVDGTDLGQLSDDTDARSSTA